MSNQNIAGAVNTIALPYLRSSDQYFRAIRELGWPIWLDSGKPKQNLGRYDILSADPTKKLITDHCGSRCIEGNSVRQHQDPWAMLRSEFQLDLNSGIRLELPFTHGAMGYLGYDLGRRLEQLFDQTDDDSESPLMLMGIYKWAIIQDHLEKASHLTFHSALPSEEVDRLITRITSHITDSSKSDAKFSAEMFSSNTSKQAYLEKIGQIKAYISAGDCYQVNFAQRFCTNYQGDPFTAYSALRDKLPSPFSAYFETEYGAILSLSPEQFLESDSSQVITQPIKGTCPRGETPEEDARLAEKLQNSTKDRAENLMIVDLLRNDLSKVCSPVETTKLFELQSYANVHHLVSTVSGRLRAGVSPVDLLQACFPGGSITGAPKIRAMEIIEEQEANRRSVYCGSIGYIDYHGRMNTNIAIRTILANKSKLFVWGGGGIVSDSAAESEYQESLSKIKLILDTINSL